MGSRRVIAEEAAEEDEADDDNEKLQWRRRRRRRSGRLMGSINHDDDVLKSFYGGERDQSWITIQSMQKQVRASLKIGMHVLSCWKFIQHKVTG